MNVKIRWIYFGSVVYVLQFPNIAALEEFRRSIDSKVKCIIEKELSVPRGWFSKSYIFSEISDEDYERCKADLKRLSKFFTIVDLFILFQCFFTSERQGFIRNRHQSIALFHGSCPKCR